MMRPLRDTDGGLARVRAGLAAARPAPSPMLTRRRAVATLVPNGGHSLFVELGGYVSWTLSRDVALRQLQALQIVAPETALAIMQPLAPALQAVDDVEWLERALSAFAEEVAIEDRRADVRPLAGRKQLVV